MSPRTKNLKTALLIFSLSLFACSTFGNSPSSETLDPVAFLADLSVNQRYVSKQELSARSNPETREVPINDNARRLQNAGITSLTAENDESIKELQRIIEQVRSIKLETKKQSALPAVVAEPAPLEAPQTQKDEKQIDLKPPYEPLTEQTVRLLNELLKNPKQLNNPLELGEVLFLSGYLKEAAAAYQEALNRSDPNDKTCAKNRAWILFQTGNCLRSIDPQSAGKMYKQLIAEYPNSPWTQAAKVQDQIIEWYQADKPQVLTAEGKS